MSMTASSSIYIIYAYNSGPKCAPLNTHISVPTGTPLHMLKIEQIKHQRHSPLQYMQRVQGSHFSETKKLNT